MSLAHKKLLYLSSISTQSSLSEVLQPRTLHTSLNLLRISQTLGIFIFSSQPFMLESSRTIFYLISHKFKLICQLLRKSVEEISFKLKVRRQLAFLLTNLRKTKRRKIEEKREEFLHFSDSKQ